MVFLSNYWSGQSCLFLWTPVKRTSRNLEKNEAHLCISPPMKAILRVCKSDEFQGNCAQLVLSALLPVFSRLQRELQIHPINNFQAAAVLCLYRKYGRRKKGNYTRLKYFPSWFTGGEWDFLPYTFRKSLLIQAQLEIIKCYFLYPQPLLKLTVWYSDLVFYQHKVRFSPSLVLLV